MPKENLSLNNGSNNELEELTRRLQLVLNGIQKQRGQLPTQGKVLEVILKHIGQAVSLEDFLPILGEPTDPADLLEAKIGLLRKKLEDQGIEIEHTLAYQVKLKTRHP